MMRALMRFYEVDIPKHLLPTLMLSVEKEELGISAGLQDRVIQAYEGIVYMDFDRKAHGEARLRHLRAAATRRSMPPLYVAYDPERAEVSDVPHRNLRELFNRGDPTVVCGDAEVPRPDRPRPRRADERRLGALGRVMNENFDLRKTIMAIAPENQRMVEVARSTGASAKFAGSGGAICGLYKDGRQYQQLADALAAIRCNILRPIIFEA